MVTPVRRFETQVQPVADVTGLGNASATNALGRLFTVIGETVRDGERKKLAITAAAYQAKTLQDLTEAVVTRADEHPNDPEAFEQSIDDFSKPYLAEVHASARDAATAHFRRLSFDAQRKIRGAKEAEDLARNQAIAAEGMDALQNEVLTMAREGRSEDALESALKLNGALEGLVKSGIVQEPAAIKLAGQFAKDVLRADKMGEFDRALDAGGEVKFLRDFMDKGLKEFPALERDLLLQDMFKEFGRHNRLEAELEARINRGQAERHRIGKKLMGQKYLDQTLTPEDLGNALANDLIDIGTAKSMEKRAFQQGPAFDDDEISIQIASDLLAFDEDTIRDEDRLTFDTRLKLMQARDSLVDDLQNWRRSPNGTRGFDLIKTEFGIVPGQLITDMSGETGRQLGRALDEYQTSVEDLPLDERPGKALDVARTIVDTSFKSKARDEVALTQQRISKLNERKREAESGGILGFGGGLSDEEQAVFQEDMDRLENRLRDAKSRAD